MIDTVRYGREFFDLPALLRNLGKNRQLIRVMTWRNFSMRFRESYGGLYWSVVQPLVMMVVYTIVFSQFLKLRFSTDASPLSFSIYLLCGLLPWNAMSEGLSQATAVIRTNVNFVKRVVFPLEILPINLALTAVIQQVIGFALLTPLVWLVTGTMQWTIVFVPAILVLQLLLAMGMNWVFASLAVYLPDLKQLTVLLLNVWLFLTPIFYPEDIAPPQALIIFQLNPLAHLTRFYRGVFITGQLPSAESLLTISAFCIVVFLLGYFWFMHTKSGFADVI